MDRERLRAVYLGTHVHEPDARGRLVMPATFRQGLRDRAPVPAEDVGFVLAPHPDGSIVCLEPWAEEVDPLQKVREIRWDGQLRRIVRSYRVHPSTALYRARNFSRAVMDARDLLATELAAHEHSIARLSGREFERLVRETLEAFSLRVESNVRIQDAEIDLLLCRDEADGGAPTVIECKQYRGSRRKVGIAQVLRAMGLAELIRDRLVPECNVILTTTGFTGPARRAAESHGVDLVAYEALAEWLDAHGLIEGQYTHPLLKPVLLDRSGRVSIPGILWEYLGLAERGSVNVVGVRDRLELWSAARFEARLSESAAREAYDSMLSRVLGPED
ncbi:MAG: restriction endonuclease [bacterium]